MAELYTHILIGYSIGMMLSWWYEWLDYSFVTVVMVGAAMPDLNRLDWIIPEATVQQVLGVPFAWWPMHRLGGIVMVAAIFSLLVSRRHRRAVFVLLLVGAASHITADLFLHAWDGVSGAYLWPVSDYRPRVGHYYRSTDRWPAILSTALAAFVWGIDSLIVKRGPRSRGDPPTSDR